MSNRLRAVEAKAGSCFPCWSTETVSYVPLLGLHFLFHGYSAPAISNSFLDNLLSPIGSRQSCLHVVTRAKAAPSDGVWTLIKRDFRSTSSALVHGFEYF